MIGYSYDGSFYGFLTCVFYAYAEKEDPAAVVPFGSQPLLIPMRGIPTENDKAVRVEKGLKRRSEEGYLAVRDGFLCEMPDKERRLLAFIRKLIGKGARAALSYADPDTAPLLKALISMREEGHLLEGFLRFSEHEGVLVSVISPKNQVLPILAQHFSIRLPGEKFLIYDARHKTGFIHTEERKEFVSIDSLLLPPVGKEEAAYRAMWRGYFQHIAIPERENPVCQRTHLSLRYRPWMTEFTEDEPVTMENALLPARA